MIFHKASFLILQSFLATISLTAQPLAPAPVPAPLRELPWGQLNFLHTTDTHGWHAGHLQEASYSADWGDYVSFASHMRDLADKEGWDMLLVDTGDRIEGNGLYDASDPKGKYTFDILKHQTIDIITTGNHELYKVNSSENEMNKTVPYFRDSYITSNLDIIDPSTGDFKPLARRYKIFTTKNQGIRVTAFGFIFNFEGGANNTRVQRVKDTVEEKWFQDAIGAKDVDLFLIAGHVAVRSEEYDTIFKAIRKRQWDTPIAFFGGHTHIRDFKKYDKKAAALESGRYMETIGFMSIDGLPNRKSVSIGPAKNGVDFKRRYIDNNLYSLQHHSVTNESNFTTDLGRNVTGMIALARKGLELDETYGCAPQSYWTNRVPFNNSNSIFYLLDRQILPDSFTESKKPTIKSSSSPYNPKLVFTNTGALRFDIFQGPFTRDCTYLVSPFTSGFRFIKNVDYKVAKRLLEVLNNNGQVLQGMLSDVKLQAFVAPEQLRLRQSLSIDLRAKYQVAPPIQTQKLLTADEPLLPGYTTVDDLDEQGDDTLHAPMQLFDTPNCIQTEVDFPQGSPEMPGVTKEGPQQVDVIYNEFIEPWLILALRYLGREYTREDTKAYLDGKPLTDIISNWIEMNWPCDE